MIGPRNDAKLTHDSSVGDVGRVISDDRFVGNAFQTRQQRVAHVSYLQRKRVKGMMEAKKKTREKTIKPTKKKKGTKKNPQKEGKFRLKKQKIDLSN